MEHVRATFGMADSSGRTEQRRASSAVGSVPIVSSENLDVTLENRKARSVLHAELRIPTAQGGSRTMHLFNLHLGLGEAERREQLRRLLETRNLQSIHARPPSSPAISTTSGAHSGSASSCQQGSRDLLARSARFPRGRPFAPSIPCMYAETSKCSNSPARARSLPESHPTTCR